MSNRPISRSETPDPWMIEHGGNFYLTFTAGGDHIEIWSSRSMEDFNNCQSRTIWRPDRETPWSDGIWAPELHHINNTWYIYVACAHPGRGNESHRTCLLRSSSQDPMDQDAWVFLGPLKGLPDHWSIDATIFELNHRLYCCYSGWPLGDNSDTQQDLFLIEMISPEEAKADTLVTISRPTFPWEKIDNHGVNEGPQFLLTPHFAGIVYSACGSWTNKYKLAALQLTGPPERILEPSSWTKWERPLMMSDPDGKKGPHGPGHASFVHERGGSGRVFCVYHATESPTDGWANRRAHVCCLEPEVFMSTDTLICGVGMMHSGGKSAVDHLPKGDDQPKKSFLEKMKEKAKETLKEL